MPIKLKRTFEKEYKKKGKTKQEADRIFYGYEVNLLKHLRGKK